MTVKCGDTDADVTVASTSTAFTQDGTPAETTDVDGAAVYTFTFKVTKITGAGAAVAFTAKAVNAQTGAEGAAETESTWVNYRNRTHLTIWEADGNAITDAAVKLQSNYDAGKQADMTYSEEAGEYRHGDWDVSNVDYGTIVITLTDGRTVTLKTDKDGNDILSKVNAGTEEIYCEYTFPAYKVTGKLFFFGDPVLYDDHNQLTSTVSGNYGTDIPYAELKKWAEDYVLNTLDAANGPTRAAVEIKKDGGTVALDETKFGEAGKLQNYVYVNVETYYTVTFMDGETEFAKEEVLCGTNTPVPTEKPTRTGYTFKGWMEAAGDELAPVTDTVIKTVTYQAQWEANTYYVNFDANTENYTGTMERQAFTYDAAQALTENAFVRTDAVNGVRLYAFDGWNTAADGSGTAYADKQTVSNLTAGSEGEITFYAQWKKVATPIDVYCYFLTVDSDGDAIELPDNEAQRAGLSYYEPEKNAVHNRWYVYGKLNTVLPVNGKFGPNDEQFKNVVAELTGESFAPYQLNEAFAKAGYPVDWTQLVYHDAGFSHAGYGKGTTDTEIDATTAHKKSYEHFTLDLSVSETKQTGTIKGDGSLVLKLFFKRNSYTVSFDPVKVGATPISPVTVKYQQCVADVVFNGQSLIPSLAGYMFRGWYDAENDAKEDGNPYTFDTKVTGSIILYAKWEKAKEVTITHRLTINYVYENGTTAAESKVLDLVSGESYSVSSPSVSGHLADKPVVKGTMPNHDLTETVVYTSRQIPSGGISVVGTPLTFSTKEHFAYVNGYPNGTVKPTGNVTRAEVAAILYRIMDADCAKAYYDTTSSYRDVARGDWFNVYVTTLENAGVIVDTRAGGYFRPNEAITRAELASMLAQFAENKKAANYFTDVPSYYWASQCDRCLRKDGLDQRLSRRHLPPGSDRDPRRDDGYDQPCAGAHAEVGR